MCYIAALGLDAQKHNHTLAGGKGAADDVFSTICLSRIGAVRISAAWASTCSPPGGMMLQVSLRE